MGGFRSLFKRKKKKTKPGPAPSQALPSRAPSFHDELKLVFEMFDANGDGKISPTELGSVLATLGHPVTSTELDRMVREADGNGDGFIDVDEFIALNTKGVDPDEVLRDAFLVFDVDRNGSISAEELMKVLKGLGEDCTVSECRKMITGVDRDGDGMIDFEEFKAMMAKGKSFEVVA